MQIYNTHKVMETSILCLRHTIVY